MIVVGCNCLLVSLWLVVVYCRCLFLVIFSVFVGLCFRWSRWVFVDVVGCYCLSFDVVLFCRLLCVVVVVRWCRLMLLLFVVVVCC